MSDIHAGTAPIGPIPTNKGLRPADRRFIVCGAGGIDFWSVAVRAARAARRSFADPMSDCSASITDSSLRTALDALSLPGITIGHRLISRGDEYALMPEEAGAFASSVVKVRRASGAARIVARRLLAQRGYAECAVPKASSGAPIWPTGVVGSLAHDSRVAVAAIAMRDDFGALGIDVEPAEALPSDLLDLVATSRERARIGDDPYRGRLLFAAKEAVYKAVYPLDQTFLEHHDVELDLAGRRAIVRNGRVVELRFCVSTHLVALAFLPIGGG